MHRVPEGQCARWGARRNWATITTGVIRACRGTRPVDALRPNRQPQKPRPKPPQNAMCLGSCSRSPEGWPRWPIAACGRHARFRLNDRPSAGLHGGPSASCGYAPVIQVQGSLARVDRLIKHHFRQNPHGHLPPSLPLPPYAWSLGCLGWMRAAPLACRPTCALHSVSIWLLHLARRPAKLPGVGPDLSQWVLWAPSRPTTVPPKPRARCVDIARDLLPMQSGDSAVARLAHPTNTRSGRRRHYSQGTSIPPTAGCCKAHGCPMTEFLCSLEALALRPAHPPPPLHVRAISTRRLSPSPAPSGMPHRRAG